MWDLKAVIQSVVLTQSVCSEYIQAGLLTKEI